jgi:REP element-mobilizing transposase RayT
MRFQVLAPKDRQLDGRCTGPRFLRAPAAAKMVMDAILLRDLRVIQLCAFMVMPNHVRLLITPLEAVSRVRQAIHRLGRTGQPFWQEETYDRLVCNETKFERITHCIERNPVTAELVEAPADFHWSGARPISNRPQDSILPHI